MSEFYFNDHLARSLKMSQDLIGVLKVLFPKKAFINGKSSERKKGFWKILKRCFSDVSLTKISWFWLNF